ncbi:hypothetical protein ACFPM3_20485 [Streptomyces coeruleoprunus]|uniref:Uncharacterized protein n=1 Tax=Streptomyces coeruleoprunus TaxID=285563 RepID=A0ABV9XJ97_9ACTN
MLWKFGQSAAAPIPIASPARIGSERTVSPSAEQKGGNPKVYTATGVMHGPFLAAASCRAQRGKGIEAQRKFPLFSKHSGEKKELRAAQSQFLCEAEELTLIHAKREFICF